MVGVRQALLVTASVLVLGTTAEAKTLVYCSEGSPEGFDPALYTSGTTFDACSRTVYNRLVEFERGTTTLSPAWPRAGTVSADGLSYTFHLRKGVKFQTTKCFTPTRDFNADDVVFTFKRQLDKSNPVLQGVAAAPTSTSTAWACPTLLEVDREGRRPHGEVHAQRSPTRRSSPICAMDFASILSAEYADKMMKAGTPEKVDLRAGRHRAVPAPRLPEGRGDPLQGQPGLLGRQGRRSTTWSSPSRPTPRCAGRSSRPASAR